MAGVVFRGGYPVNDDERYWADMGIPRSLPARVATVAWVSTVCLIAAVVIGPYVVAETVVGRIKSHRKGRA